ncbi:MAG: hypothetical protein U0559_10400 [Anaerolineae bacterium]
MAINPPNGAALNETYDLYAWDGKQWTWLGAFLDTTSNTVSAQVSSLPKQVALFQSSTSLAPSMLPRRSLRARRRPAMRQPC